MKKNKNKSAEGYLVFQEHDKKSVGGINIISTEYKKKKKIAPEINGNEHCLHENRNSDLFNCM